MLGKARAHSSRCRCYPDFKKGDDDDNYLYLLRVFSAPGSVVRMVHATVKCGLSSARNMSSQRTNS